MLNHLSLLLLFLFPVSQTCISINRDANSQAKTVQYRTKDIGVSIHTVKTYSDRWEIDFEVRNNTQRSLFYTTAPKRSNGDLGPYIGIPEATTLEIGAKFFDRPAYFLSSDLSSVKLRQLEAGSSQIERYNVPLPFNETTPPYQERINDPLKSVEADRVEYIRLYIAVVPDDEGIRNLLVPKPSKPFFTGYLSGGETIESGRLKGKMLLETQSVFCDVHKVDRNR